MGTVDTIRTWATTNDFFEDNIVQQGKNVFIPSEKKYPHIHIGPDFITYSKSDKNHMYIVDKGSEIVNQGRVLNAYQGCGEAHIMQACRYMSSQF
jgi:hypothetical protein